MPASPKRVVITGIGAITAAGWTAPDLWQALLDARCAATPIHHLGAHGAAVAGQIAEFDGPSGVPQSFKDRLGRSSRLALDAAIQAIADARINFTLENAYQVAAIIGSAHGATNADGDAWPFFSTGLSGSTMGLNIAGPAYSINADGASALVAIQQATDLIRNDHVSVALAGGADAPLSPEVWAAYQTAGLLSSQADPTAQRPFDLLRDGLILGEGAGVLVLEDRDIAVPRGARIYAEVIGTGFTSGPPGDGFAPTDVDIARRAITTAIRDANRSPNEIDVVFTAGIGTPAGDKRETDILERAFGSRIVDTYVSAVSPVTGYTAGAAGALSAIAAAFTLTEQIMPPHATYSEPDPDCALDITTTPQRDHLAAALISGYGSMGQNAAIILATHQSEPGDEVPIV